MVVILGHRRQRTFERVLFFLCLSLFLFYSGSLLFLNGQIHYGEAPQSLRLFSWPLICAGLLFVPSLPIHLHVEYAHIRGILHDENAERLWLAASYLPLAYFLPLILVMIHTGREYDFATPINAIGVGFKIWFATSFLVGLSWQRRFAREAADGEERSFHKQLVWQLAIAASWVLIIHAERNAAENSRVFVSILLAAVPLKCLGVLVRKVHKFNFLQIGRQSNLIYAVVLAFAALLYLSFVRRVSLWLEPTLPPEATAAILLFLPVVFFEPLQRVLRATLRKTAHNAMDLTQRMMGPIPDVAPLGNFSRLIQ